MRVSRRNDQKRITIPETDENAARGKIGVNNNEKVNRKDYLMRITFYCNDYDFKFLPSIELAQLYKGDRPIVGFVIGWMTFGIIIYKYK